MRAKRKEKNEREGVRVTVRVTARVWVGAFAQWPGPVRFVSNFSSHLGQIPLLFHISCVFTLFSLHAFGKQWTRGSVWVQL